MDFQQILNLLKGNLGGAGMRQAEDGNMVHGGYYDQPQTPMSADNVITNGLVKTGALPQSRAEIYPNPNDTPLPQLQGPQAPDIGALIRRLLGQ